MKFRALLPDWFIDVEAETEREAAQKALKIVRAEIDDKSFIIWEADKQVSDQLNAGTHE